MSSIRKAEAHLARLKPLPEKLAIDLETAERFDDPSVRGIINDGIGARLQAIYTGFEALIEATLRSLNLDLPAEQAFHQALLETARKHELISDEEKGDLEGVKGFRHIQRHTYDIVLEYETLKEGSVRLIRLLPPILDRIERILSDLRSKPGLGFPEQK